MGPDLFWPIPTVWAGSGLEENRGFCWAEIGPTLLGLSPAWLVGRASPAHLALYIIYYIVFVLFIYIDIYKKN